MSQEQKEIIITTPDWVYTINPLENTGAKQANPKKFMIQEFNSLSKSEQKKVVKNAESQGTATIGGMGGDLQKNATKIMGYNCDKVTMAGTALYVISGTDLALKINGSTMGMEINEAVINIKEESGPSSKFELPSNINFEHNIQADQMMQEQAKTVIQQLLGDSSAQVSSAGAGTQTQSQAPATPEKSQAGGQETQDATIDQVTDGVKSAFKSLFN